jgi:coenzyme F420-reducing hydrogenase beta subunit
MLREKKRYAVIGLPCSLKALRLAMLTEQRLRECVVVLAGLVCGQTKSRAFSEYLIRSEAIAPEQVRSFSFREKDVSRPASSYFAKVTDSTNSACLPWSGLYGSTWLSGEFTPRACRFCDDAFAEVADVSFMDAWLPEYVSDNRGTSIVIVRSQAARQLVDDGIAQGTISMRPLAIDKVIASQAGVVKQKRAMLANRLWITGRKGLRLRKRVAPVRPSWFGRLLLEARENLRKTSHEASVVAGSGGKSWLHNYQAKMQSSRWRMNALLLPGKCLGRARVAASGCIRIMRLR